MALEVDDAGVRLVGLELGLALLLRAEHGGHGGGRLFDDASGACAALRAWVVAGCLPSAARRGVDGGRGGCPRPIGGFAGDEASMACARPCRLTRRYRALPSLQQRVVAGFSASRDASPR